jgi:hypothetical protein
MESGKRRVVKKRRHKKDKNIYLKKALFFTAYPGLNPGGDLGDF